MVQYQFASTAKWKSIKSKNNGGIYLNNVIKIFKQIQSTTSTNEKINIIKKNSDNELFKKWLENPDDFENTLDVYNSLNYDTVPLELKEIKKELGKDFIVLTPGIRPSWTLKDDQKRIATPKSAISDGADYIVLGRAVTKAENKLEAIEKIYEEINEVI